MDFNCARALFLNEERTRLEGLLTNEATQFDPIGGNPRLSSEEEWSLGLAPPAGNISNGDRSKVIDFIQSRDCRVCTKRPMSIFQVVQSFAALCKTREIDWGNFNKKNLPGIFFSY